jgi:cobalamin biosynthesis Co2+ chelatase CbiK
MTKRVEDQVDTIKSLTQKLEAFKLSHSNLVNKYDILINKVACATNLSTYEASLEQEKKVLNDKLEKLTSKHMALQACHKELECSHDKLVESYTCLEVAHEVVLSSVTSTQPLTHTCTCSHVNIELSCAKPCCSQASQSSIEHVFVETCDDLIAKENDQLMEEVENLKEDLSKLKGKSQVQPCKDNRDIMVEKLEKGSNRISSTLRLKRQGNNPKAQEIKKKELDHIKYFNCSKMGHYISMCSPQLKDNKAKEAK